MVYRLRIPCDQMYGFHGKLMVQLNDHNTLLGKSVKLQKLPQNLLMIKAAREKFALDTGTKLTRAPEHSRNSRRRNFKPHF